VEGQHQPPGQVGLRCCYAAARQRQPDLAGRLVLALDLDGDGRVKSVSPRGEKSDINDETMTACVVATGRELAFPASRRGRPTRVTLPLLFRPREAR
ncbi:MAG: AgmX/PglI C-terminal domain-containing protein, partial [Myxococcales bacterium]